MTLKEIIDAAKAGVTVISEQGPMGQEITSVTLDSRKACAGALFVAQCGEKVDGHAFIGKAIEAGCRAIVCEKAPADAPADCAIVVISDAHKRPGHLAAAF